MRPLLVQHHISKTAGTSLRQVTRANFKGGEVEDIERLFPTDRIVPKWDWSTARRRYREAYHALPSDRRDRIRCFIGHTAPLLAAALDDRPVLVFTMLRDPVERVLSLWSHAQWLVDNGRPTAWGPLVAAMRDRGWSLADAYRELPAESDASPSSEAAFQPLFNEQSRLILLRALDSRQMPFSSDERQLEPYRERAFEVLSEAYVVGVVERFSESVRQFAERFGWGRAFVPHVNVRRAAIDVDDETPALIREHNRLDAALHGHYLEHLSRLPALGFAGRIRGSAYQRAHPYLRRTRMALARSRGRRAS